MRNPANPAEVMSALAALAGACMSGLKAKKRLLR